MSIILGTKRTKREVAQLKGSLDSRFAAGSRQDENKGNADGINFAMGRGGGVCLWQGN